MPLTLTVDSDETRGVEHSSVRRSAGCSLVESFGTSDLLVRQCGASSLFLKSAIRMCLHAIGGLHFTSKIVPSKPISALATLWSNIDCYPVDCIPQLKDWVQQ